MPRFFYAPNSHILETDQREDSFMVDIGSISKDLKLGEDGIWYGSENQAVSYPQDGNENCFALEDESFWFRHRNHCIARLVTLFPPADGRTVFDLGGGNGFVSVGLAEAGFEPVLVEPGPTGAGNAKQRGLENVICASVEAATFSQGSLPAVGLFDVVEHIENDLEFLRSVRDLLQPGGRLYATVPAYSALWSGEDIRAGHFRRYNLSSFSRLLEQTGFEVEFASYIFRFLPLPIFLFRVLPFRLGLAGNRERARNTKKDHIPKSGLLTRLLDVFLKSEIALLDQKKALRFGGSCIVVARAKT